MIIWSNAGHTSEIPVGVDWPGPISDEEIERLTDEMRRGQLFYWINSRLRFFTDMDFLVDDQFHDVAPFSAGYRPDDPVHCINLTLLPHTEEDLAWLEAALGTGSVEILSRGYGNCRVTATATPQVWRVQFFNSMDTSILDTYEVTAVPEVVLAATEDLADSGERLLEVLEAIR